MENYQALLHKLSVNTHEDALIEIARLKERTAILAMIMDRMGVKAHWEAPDAFNELYRKAHKKKD